MRNWLSPATGKEDQQIEIKVLRLPYCDVREMDLQYGAMSRERAYPRSRESFGFTRNPAKPAS